MSRQHGCDRLPPVLSAGAAQGVEEIHPGRHVDLDLAALAPIGGDLQHHRSAEPPVSEQHGFLEPGLSAGDGGVRGHAGQGFQPRQQAGLQGQGHKARARGDHADPEAPGDVIAEPGRAHLGYRLPARGDHQRSAVDLGPVERQVEAIGRPLDAAHGRGQPEAGAMARHLGLE